MPIEEMNETGKMLTWIQLQDTATGTHYRNSKEEHFSARSCPLTLGKQQSRIKDKSFVHQLYILY